MKEKIIVILSLLVLMAVLPFVTLRLCIKTELPNLATPDNAPIHKTLFGLVAAEYQEEYCDEAVKALAIIINTNYISNEGYFDLADKKVYLNNEQAKEKLGENYDKVRQIVSMAEKKTLCTGGKTSFVPYSKISNGKTVSDKAFNYIPAVASPWDCFSSSYDENAECFGASLYGINYLCQNGYSAEEALLWYYPSLEVAKL